MTIENSDLKQHSPSIPCNHKHWAVAFTTPLYSTSLDESVMALCFLLNQLIGPSTRMNTYPKVYFQFVFSPTQSLSVNPTSSKSDFSL